MAIPAYITPLSYIRGSGTQYITTDIYLRSTDTIKSKWRFEGQAGNTYGCYTSGGSDDNFCLYAGSQSVNAYIRYNGQVVREFKPATGTIHELEQGPDGFYDDGVKLVDFDPATFTCSAPMYIFMLPNSSSAKVSARCYGLRIYRDGALAYNFIPAENTKLDEVGMWESVNGVWYSNAGTGAFTAGPETVVPLKSLLLKRRRGLMDAATDPIIHLPAGYTRVDYLYFDGTAYIDLGYGANEATDAAYIDFMITPTVTAQMRLFSANEASTAAAMYVSGSLGISFRWHNQSGYVSGGGVGTAGVRHTSYIDYSASERRAVFDGVQKNTTMNGSTTSYAQSTNSHYLVCGPATNNARFKGRVYEVKTWRNGVLFRHLVPCKDANNVGHMYDVKNGVMYSNAASSGALTPGIESEYLYEFPAELTKHNGAVSADSTHGAYIDTNSKRRSFVLRSGVLAFPLHPYQGGADEWSTSDNYPIPIPQNAVSVTLSITPSTAYIGPRFVYIDNGIYATAVDGNPGWMQGTNTITIPAGSTHICINTKYNSAGDSYPTDMPTAVKVQFNTE